MDQLEEDLKANNKKKIYIGLGVGILVIGIVTLILLLTLEKGDDHNKPVPPPTPPTPNFDFTVNPYQKIQETTDASHAYSYRQYRLTRNSTLGSSNLSSSFRNGAVETQHNKFIENVTLRTSVFGSFNTVRMQFLDETNPYYQVSDDFLSEEYDKEKTTGSRRRFAEMNTKFSMDLTPKEQLAVNTSAFSLRAHTPEGQDFLTTKNMEFVMMTHYQQISFEVKSTRMLGFGDSSKLFLQSGNHTINAGSHHSSGAHPFLMMQLSGTSKFTGLYLLNASPLSLELEIYNSSSQKADWSKLTFRINSGVLDLFLFYGPTFDQVIRQYQDLIGRPKILPLWAHGFFAQSEAYLKSEQAIEAISGFQQAKFPLSGLVLPMNYKQEYMTGNSQLVKDIRAKYPSTKEMQLIYPMSYLVPDTTGVSWIDDFKKSNNGLTFAVKADNQNLYIEVQSEDNTTTTKGWCMDVFNPKFVNDFLEPKLLRNVQDIYQGLWLQHNFPSVHNFTHNFTDPWNITYRVAENNWGVHTLPEQAVHDIKGTNTTKAYHASVHGVFGATFAKQVIMNSPTFRSQLQRPFIITDSTFSGLGQYGAAHFLPSMNASYADLKRQLSSMIHLGMHGIPNVGVRMCDFALNATDFDDAVCGKYFQMAIFAPLALYSDRKTDLSSHPYHANNTEDVFLYVSSLFLRNSMLIYQRTQLALLERWGGALLRPMFAEYPESHKDYEGVEVFMWGSDVMVDFFTENATVERNMTLPKENDWVSLTTFATFKGGESVLVKPGSSYNIGLFQKAGTIVPQQDATSIKTVADLRNETIKLIIALSKDGRAYGNIYLEDGGDVEGYRTELHEVWVEDQVIGFKQQDTLSQNDYANDTIIDSIRISFVESPVNTACALLKDMRTIRQLAVGPYDEEAKQAFLQTHDVNNTEKSLKINEIAYIYYGYSEKNDAKCSELFSYKVDEVLNDGDNIFEVELHSGLQSIMESFIPPQYLQVQLLTDNSLSVQISDRRLNDKTTDRETPTQIYDRNYTELKAEKNTIKLSQVLQKSSVNAGEYFCFNITDPSNSTLVYLSTCGNQVEAQHSQHHVFNFVQRESMKGRFFGLGERKGDFFLKDDTTYSLYNNNNNVRNSAGAFGDTNEHSRNGFHPIIYSSLQNSTNMTALMFYTGHGLEIAFDEQPDMQGAAFSVHSSSRDMEFVFLFNLEPLKISQILNQHVKIGSLLKTAIPDFQLPAPLWAIGHHATILSNDGNGVKNYVEGNIPKEFPMEGLFLHESDMQNGYSMTIEGRLFKKEDLEWYKQQDLSMIQVSASGFPTVGRHDKDPVEEATIGLRVQTLDNKDYTGFDDNGQVIYIDYSKPDASKFINKLTEEYNLDKFGVSLLRNEVSKQQCSIGSCFIDYSDLPTSTWFIHRPGPLDQTVNTFFQVKRELGLEEQLHNVNGLMEQIQYKNAEKNIPLVISDSTSLGSGKLGNVAHLLDYYDLTSEQDLTLLTQNLQALSVLGLPMVSPRFSGIQARLGGDHNLVKRAILFSTYSTAIGVNEFYGAASRELMDAKERLEFTQLLNLKYVMSAYTRSQLFKQINMGAPVIHPMYFHFPGTEGAIGTNYMYGPAVVATTDLVYSRQTQLPKDRLFCFAHTVSADDSFCFSDGTIPAKYDGKAQVILNAGHITPLYQYNKTDAANTNLGRGAILKQNLDLHIMHYDNKSTGELLVDGGKGKQGNNDYCILYFNMQNDTINITDITAFHGGKPASGNCSTFNGQTFSTLYLYDYRNITPTSNGYQSAKVNGDEYLMDLIELDSNEHVGVFTLMANATFDGQLPLSMIKSIVLSEVEPPKPAVITVY